MAVAARTPGPSEARVPCPLCGGLIHPIAGRCKHCKADIAAQRASRPAAMAALPALAAPGMGPVLLDPVVAAPTDATYVPQFAGAPAPVVAVSLPRQDDSRPILPPRPTGRMQSEPSRSLWRNWPVIVIVVAVLAIAAAVVLMLLPPAAKASGTTKLPPPPAPERMDTNPMAPRDPGASIPRGGADPWSNRNHGGTPPAPPPPDDPDATIDPDDLLKDPFANPRGGSSGVFGGNPFGSMGGGGALVFAMVQRACDRMKQCPGSAAVDMCTVLEQSLGQFPMPPPPQSCVAAQRCLSQIDRLDLCGGSTSSNGLADVTMLLSTAQDCIDAARC